MSGSGLQVQCLASTRIHDRGQDEEELDEDKERNKACDSEGEIRDQEVSDGLRSSRGEDDATSKLEQEHVNTSHDPPRLPSPSPSPLSSNSTSDSEDSTDSSSDRITATFSSTPHISCIQESQLSPDGSCIITSDYSRSLTVYPISSTLFNPPHPKPLAPYAKLTSLDPIWAFATNPKFNISDPSTTHVLLSRRDRYITLHNAVWSSDNHTIDPNHTSHPPSPLDILSPLASYKLISPLTEALTAPSSLTYSHDSTHFFAGLRNTIALFDIEHQSSPIQRIPTIPSARNVRKGGGVGYKGVITSLSLSPTSSIHHNGILAAGTRTRWIGLYDSTSAENISSFALPRDGDRGARGAGVTSLKWSPDGRYLYIAERRSDVLLIYDVRNFTTCLAYCTGRKADTNQKLGFDVWSAGAVGGFADGASGGGGHETVSHEIWAGGIDGCVRVWRDPWAKEGGVQADEVVRVGEGNMPVVGTMVHASGGLAGVACGWVGVGEGEGDEMDVDDERVSRGVMQRMRGVMPRIKEGGSVDILGLS